MTLLTIFCPECTPWLLLMLAGAWILGWLFWAMFKGSSYQSQIKQLSGDLEDTQKVNTVLQKDMAEANYKMEKQATDYAEMQQKYADLDIRYKAQGEALQAAKSGIDPDASNWERRLAKMGDELTTVKAAKEQLQADFNKIKADYEALKPSV
ncbi:MAG: hypothetical protein AAFV95_10370 [Bacteroidota bacterium]